MSYIFRGRGDIATAFFGFLPEFRSLRIQMGRPVNISSLAFAVTVFVFIILNSNHMSTEFLVWIVVAGLMTGTVLKMNASRQEIEADAAALTEVRLQMPHSTVLAATGRLQAFGLHFALLDTNFINLNYATLRSVLDVDNNTSTTPGLSEDEIDALPLHIHKVTSHQSILLDGEGSSLQQVSSLPVLAQAKGDYSRREVNMKALDEDDLTCTICLEQVKKGELVRSLPCLHQFHGKCIDKWLQQKGTCPMCNLIVMAKQDIEREADVAHMV